jgi:pimeloyl-ACP methyl ester carboxylesterase
MTTSLERTLVPVRGGHLHVQAFGSGRPLVLLHGLADHMGTWSRLLPLLPPDRRVILADLPGHGLSTRQGPYDADAIADRLHDAFDALGLDDLDLVAHSLGGAASLALAPRLGRRLARLALIAPAGLSSAVPFHLRIAAAAPLPPARLLQPLVGPITRVVAATPLAFYDADEARALAWANAAPGTLEAWLGTLRAHVSLRGLTPTIAERIEEIAGHGPALSVFFGDADPVIPAAHARTMMRAVANATFCVAPGLGHVPHRQAPELVASWLREFLASEPVPVAPRRAVVVAGGFRMPWYRRAARAVADFFRFGRPALGA